MRDEASGRRWSAMIAAFRLADEGRNGSRDGVSRTAAAKVVMAQIKH